MRAGKPDITVIMAAYNAAEHITEAIDSILAQTHADFELIVVDNCSTDTTPEILACYTDPRLLVIRNDTNKERCVSRNIAVSRAKTELIAVMDADDYSLPHRLERQIAFMHKNPHISICGGFMEEYETGKLIIVEETDPRIRLHLMVTSQILHPVSVYRKSVFERAGGYRTEFVATEDYDLWARMAELSDVRFANIPEVLARYRVYPGVQRVQQVQQGHREIICPRVAGHLVPTMTEEDVHSHNHLLRWEKEATLEELARCQTWVETLLAANVERKYYDQELFRDFWLRLWLDTCRASLSFALFQKLRSNREIDPERRSKLKRALRVALLQKLQNKVLPSSLRNKRMHHKGP